MNYSPFDGEGRVKIDPISPRRGTRPTSMTNSQARRLIDMFVTEGRSDHSESGATLWVIEVWCKEHGVPLAVVEQRIGGVLAGYSATKAPA